MMSLGAIRGMLIGLGSDGRSAGYSTMDYECQYRLFSTVIPELEFVRIWRRTCFGSY